jgi:hypothetical protein
MANELTISTSMTFSKGGATQSMSKNGLQVTVSGTKYVKGSQSIATTETAIKLGDLASLGFCMIRNTDATNFVSIRAGTGTGNFLKILPGETQGPFRFGSGATAPYAIADTAAVILEYMIVEP